MPDLPERGETAVSRPPARSGRTRRALAVAVALLAVSPLLLLLVEEERHAPREPLFESDLAAVELGVIETLHGERRLGLGSRFGWSHPGPAYFELLAPFYVASGHASRSLLRGALLLHLAALLLALWAARRYLGETAFYALAVAVLALQKPPVSVVLFQPWPPFQLVTLIVPALVLAAAIAAGATGLVGPFLLVASVAVQLHVGSLPVLGVCFVVALLFAAFRPADARPRAAGRRWPARIAWCLLLLLVWTPPVVEQVSSSRSGREGNFTKIQRSLLRNRPDEHRLGLGASLALVNDVLSRGVDSAARPWSFDHPTWRDRRREALRRRPVLQWLAALLALLLIAVRVRGPSRSFRAGVVALAALAATLFAGAGIVRGPQPYLLAFGLGVAGFALASLLALAATLAARLLSRPGRAATWRLAATGTVAVMAVTVLARPGLAFFWQTRRVDIPFSVAAERAAGKGCVRIGASEGAWPQAVGTFLVLTKQGVDAHVREPLDLIVGSRYWTDRTDCADVWVVPTQLPRERWPDPGATVVARGGPTRLVLGRRAAAAGR